MNDSDPQMTVEAFVLRQTPRLRGLLRMWVRHDADAEDLLQATFIAYMTKGPDPAAQHAEYWLMKTARNIAYNHLRGEKRRRQREADRTNPAPLPTDPSHDADRRESLDRIRDCLGKLPLKLREPLYLHVVEGLSLRQIAEQTDVGKSTIASRVQRGLVDLNRCFQGGTR